MAKAGGDLGHAVLESSRIFRSLILSLATRSSFVVLPLALILGPEWNQVAVVIVFQSLVDLFGRVAYL